MQFFVGLVRLGCFAFRFSRALNENGYDAECCTCEQSFRTGLHQERYGVGKVRVRGHKCVVILARREIIPVRVAIMNVWRPLLSGFNGGMKLVKVFGFGGLSQASLKDDFSFLQMGFFTFDQFFAYGFIKSKY